MRFTTLVTPLLALAIAGCAHRPASPAPATVAPTLSGDPGHPGETKGWVDTRLYFGLGPADQPGQGVSEARMASSSLTSRSRRVFPTDSAW